MTTRFPRLHRSPKPAATWGATRLPRRSASFRAASLSLLALCALSACQSPFQQGASDTAYSRYADSILARELADGSIRGAPTETPTRIGGVHEFTRVDSAGPGAVTPPGTTDSTPAAPQLAQAPVPTPPAGASAPAATAPAGPTGTETPQRFDTVTPARLAEPEPVIRLSLQQTLARALQHSLTIKVEAYNPGIKEAQVTNALAAFDPTFITQSQFQNLDDPLPLNATSNGVNWTTTTGLKQLLPSGGTVQFGVGDSYRSFQDPLYLIFGTPTSSHAGIINLQVSQPLLRGFGSDVNQANIYLAQKDQRISLTQFRRQVISSMADVEDAYNTLVLNTAVADIQERLYAETYETWRRVKERAAVDADKTSIMQALSAVQSRQADLIHARADVRNASDKLKDLINDPELDIGSNVLVVPSDRPVDTPLSFDVADELAVALRQRTELQEARLQIERADIVVDVSRNNLLPKADLTLSVQSSSSLDSGLDRAFTQTIDATKYVDYAAGIRVEIPLGNRAAESDLRRRTLERRQAVAQMLLIAQQVCLDVKLQMRGILASYQEYEARDSARVAGAEELKAIIAREQVEKLTPEFLQLKLDSQQRLANAEIEEAQALVNYNEAIMRLEQAKGTLLEFNRISIGPAPITGDENKLRFMGRTFDLGN